MTKQAEEILNKNTPRIKNHPNYDFILKSMQEYADLTHKEDFEFIEWLRENCLTHCKNIRVGMQWAIVKEISDWDGEPNKWYTSDELFEYWKKYIK
jgi:hypothetical protein